MAGVRAVLLHPEAPSRPAPGAALSMLAVGGACGAFDTHNFYLTGGTTVHGGFVFREVLSKPPAGLA